MPGTNAGTGYPITLRCAICRRSLFSETNRRGYRLVATGRIRKPRRRIAGPRCTNRRIEVRCLDCGHVGWTKHIDAESLLRRLE